MLNIRKRKKKKNNGKDEHRVVQLNLPDVVEPEQMETVKEVAIPDKLFFKIGDTSKLAGVDSHVLRFWESEFKQLKPTKNKNGQRVYTKKDVAVVLRIKKLLYDEKFTIAGAKKKLAEEFGRQNKRGKTNNIKPETHAILVKVHKDLKNLLTKLGK